MKSILATALMSIFLLSCESKPIELYKGKVIIRKSQNIHSNQVQLTLKDSSKLTTAYVDEFDANKYNEGDTIK